MFKACVHSHAEAVSDLEAQQWRPGAAGHKLEQLSFLCVAEASHGAPEVLYDMMVLSVAT